MKLSLHFKWNKTKQDEFLSKFVCYYFTQSLHINVNNLQLFLSLEFSTTSDLHYLRTRKQINKLYSLVGLLLQSNCCTLPTYLGILTIYEQKWFVLISSYVNDVVGLYVWAVPWLRVGPTDILESALASGLE